MTDRHDTDTRDVETRDVETPDREARDVEARDREARDVETSGTVVRDIERRNVNARAVEPDASPTPANGAHANDKAPESWQSIFDPNLEIVDHDNFLNRLYDAPDEDWFRWRLSADGKTWHRF